MSTEAIAALMDSVNKHTETVSGKMGEIDRKVDEKIAEVDETVSNLFLDPRFGISPSYESKAPQDIPGFNSSDIFVVPVLIYDVKDFNAFTNASFVLDIFAQGASSSLGQAHRQVHVSFKQQHSSFGYSVKVESQNGGEQGMVFMTFDPNGGTLWERSICRLGVIIVRL